MKQLSYQPKDGQQYKNLNFCLNFWNRLKRIFLNFLSFYLNILFNLFQKFKQKFKKFLPKN